MYNINEIPLEVLIKNRKINEIEISQYLENENNLILKFKRPNNSIVYRKKIMEIELKDRELTLNIKIKWFERKKINEIEKYKTIKKFVLY